MNMAYATSSKPIGWNPPLGCTRPSFSVAFSAALSEMGKVHKVMGRLPSMEFVVVGSASLAFVERVCWEDSDVFFRRYIAHGGDTDDVIKHLKAEGFSEVDVVEPAGPE